MPDRDELFAVTIGPPARGPVVLADPDPRWPAQFERMARFRDRLRADAADRERYAAKKRELAAREWEYVQDYADAKADVVEDILTRA